MWIRVSRLKTPENLEFPNCPEPTDPEEDVHSSLLEMAVHPHPT